MGEAQQLHATFLSAINDLRSMHEKQVSWHNHTASYSYNCVFAGVKMHGIGRTVSRRGKTALGKSCCSNSGSSLLLVFYKCHLSWFRQRNKAAATTYKSLDERINLVAGKVNN